MLLHSVMFHPYVIFFSINRKQASLWIHGDIFKTRHKDVNENGEMITLSRIYSVSARAGKEYMCLCADDLKGVVRSCL